eukprot:365913-Chlamydomonas_euryale.AAC.4
MCGAVGWKVHDTDGRVAQRGTPRRGGRDTAGLAGSSKALRVAAGCGWRCWGWGRHASQAYGTWSLLVTLFHTSTPLACTAPSQPCTPTTSGRLSHFHTSGLHGTHPALHADHKRPPVTLPHLWPAWHPPSLSNAKMPTPNTDRNCCRRHEATHPRLGVADHISIQPLGFAFETPFGLTFEANTDAAVATGPTAADAAVAAIEAPGQKVPNAEGRLSAAGSKIPNARGQILTAGSRILTAGGRIPTAGGGIPTAGDKPLKAEGAAALAPPVPDMPTLGSPAAASDAALLCTAAECAREIGRQLAESCPVYFYGAAHAGKKRLADVGDEAAYRNEGARLILIRRPSMGFLVLSCGWTHKSTKRGSAGGHKPNERGSAEWTHKPNGRGSAGGHTNQMRGEALSGHTNQTGGEGLSGHTNQTRGEALSGHTNQMRGEALNGHTNQTRGRER